MSLTMYRTSSLASSGLQRSSTGAEKSSRTFGTSSVGKNYSSSSTNSSLRLPKQAHSSNPRALPNGPGPLPNKPCVPGKSDSRDIKYVASPREPTSSSRVHHFSHQKICGIDSPTVRRKLSNDSGYGSSGRNGYGHGDLSRSKSKSLSQLNSHRDETNDLSRSPSIRSRRDSSVHGVSTRTGHSYAQNHSGSKATLNGGSNTKSSSRSIYRSTTHLDYKDPNEDKITKSLNNGGHSYSSDKDLSNAYTTTGKENYSIIDVDKTRKTAITALPGSDMKCARKSSFSSSNSSPSNSVSFCGT